MDKDSKRQRELEDYGGGLLPAVEGHNLELHRIEQKEVQSLSLYVQTLHFFIKKNTNFTTRKPFLVHQERAKETILWPTACKLPNELVSVKLKMTLLLH